MKSLNSLMAALVFIAGSSAFAGTGRTLLQCSVGFEMIQSQQSGDRVCVGGVGHCEYIGLTLTGTLPAGDQVSDYSGHLTANASVQILGDDIVLKVTNISLRMPRDLLVPLSKGDAIVSVTKDGQDTDLQVSCESTEYIRRVLLLVTPSML